MWINIAWKSDPMFWEVQGNAGMEDTTNYKGVEEWESLRKQKKSVKGKISGV